MRGSGREHPTVAENSDLVLRSALATCARLFLEQKNAVTGQDHSANTTQRMGKGTSRNRGALLPESVGGSFRRSHIDAATISIEKNPALNEGENRVVSAQSDIAAWLPLRATLANDDVAGNDDLTTELFHTEALALAVAAVLDASLSLLVCHGLLLLKKNNIVRC